MKINNLILKLFGKAIPGDKTDVTEVSRVAAELGYAVHPSVCTVAVAIYLRGLKRDYNSSFYKTWHDIISKNRFELFLDQIQHYASTYGTDYQGEPWLPTGTAEAPEISKLKVILPITEAEVIQRCVGMLYSGIALKQETIEDILSILVELKHPMYPEFINGVKNKEAKMFLYDKLNMVPSTPVEMVRYLVFKATQKTLLIKDRATLAAIEASHLDVSDQIILFGVKELSAVFHRFKPIFLAFKKAAAKNAKTINSLRRSAVKNHVPTKPGYFETLLAKPRDVDPDTLKARLSTLNNFKKVTLLQAINVRLKQMAMRAFVVRNQKLFIKTPVDNSKGVLTKGALNVIENIIYDSLVESIKTKACTIKLPLGVNLTLPTSEKSFIGNYPLGTSFDFPAHDCIFGINWKEEDGARDLDLSLTDLEGTKTGWNARFYNDDKSIVFSGDMTSANPEATELFYSKFISGFKPSIAKVNLYNGEDNAKFKFFLAKEKIVKMDRNYMVDPNNILISVDCEMDSKEKILGVIMDGKFILAQFRSGRGRVSTTSVTDLYTDYSMKTLDCYVELNELLTDAGFTIVTEGEADIDLTDLSKDTLMSLIASEPVVETV